MSAPPAPLPSLDELARSPSLSLTAPAASLLELFQRFGAALSEELLQSMSLFPEVVFGAGVASAIAAVASVARLVGFTAVALVVICCVVGTFYGIVRIGLGNTRYVSRRSGQDVTVAMPLVVGFGYGLVAAGEEALLSLTPVPSLVFALVLAPSLGALWFFRYRPRSTFSDRIPGLGATLALLRRADPASVATVTWNDLRALPSDGLRYGAHVTRADGARIACAIYLRAQGEALQITADFPPSYLWRYPTERVVLDGLTLEHRVDADGAHVRTTNTHARASEALSVKAVSMTALACAPPGQAPHGTAPSYGA